MMTKTFNTYDSVLAADYLRALAFEHSKNFNVTKVQKLLYICYGYYLARHNQRLVNEHPQAWPYGPVFPRVRNHVDFSHVTSKSDPKFSAISHDQTVTELFLEAVRDLGDASAKALSDWSHQNDSPWDLTVKANGGKWGATIVDDLIKPYFSSLEASENEANKN